MSNAINANNLVGICNLINHTIVTDTYSPIVFTAAKLSATWRPWVLSERAHRANDPVVNRIG